LGACQFESLGFGGELSISQANPMPKQFGIYQAS
jgi:hypothetical protein